MTTTSVSLYTELVAAAFDASQAEETRKGMTAYYIVNKQFAFAAALRLSPHIDIARMPIVEVIESLRQAMRTGDLSPAEWYSPAIEAAANEFYDYKSYVSYKLSFMRKSMTATGEFDRWAAGLKVGDLLSPLCWMWQRVPPPRMFSKLSILDADLQARIVTATAPVLEPRKGNPKARRSIMLSSVRTYMEMTKTAVLESLQASMCEAVQLRLQRMMERGPPSIESAGPADLIPDFSPSRASLEEVPFKCVCFGTVSHRRRMLCTANTQTPLN